MKFTYIPTKIRRGTNFSQLYVRVYDCILFELQTPTTFLQFK